MKRSLGRLHTRVSSTLDPLPMACLLGVRVDDANIYLLHLTLSNLEFPRSSVRVMFFNFHSAFNTIQPSLLWGKLEAAGCKPTPGCWDHQLLL